MVTLPVEHLNEGVKTERDVPNHPHPYHPVDLQLPGYHPMVVPLHVILGTFFGVTTAVLLLTWLLASSVKRLRTSEKLMICWFVFSGITHVIVEGSFVLNPRFYTDTTGNLLLDLWKEYSKADSRYASRDSLVVSIEGCTSFVKGPLCFLAAAGLLWRKPWRYSVIFIVSLPQLYGTILYGVTEWIEGFSHARPEPLYFWFYLVFMNAIWLVAPTLCMLYAAHHTNRACQGSANKAKQR